MSGPSKKPTENLELDNGKAAQISATFAVTIFLSLNVLLVNMSKDHIFLYQLLWFSSGFFGLSAMRLIDKIFDHRDDYEIWGAMIQVGNKSFLSFDERWKDDGFRYYFLGWVTFLGAYFFVGCLIFLGTTPDSMIELIQMLISNWVLLVWAGVICLTTILSGTREFLFIN